MAVKEHKRKDATKWFQIDFRDQEGRRVREFGGHTRTQAKRLLEQRRSEVRLGTYVNPRQKVTTTVEEAVDRFIEEYASQKRTAYYRHALKRFTAKFGDRKLWDIKPAELDAFRHELHASHRERSEKHKLGASTIRKYLTATAKLFAWAKRQGLIEVNPAADLEKPGEPKHKIRYLTQDEWNGLLDVAPAWLRPILTLAVATGMRLKEVVGLRWEDVAQGDGLLCVSGDNKTGRPRAVPLGEAAREVLEAQDRHRRETARATSTLPEYVFLDASGQPYTSERARNRISQWTRWTMEKASIRGASFHTLRHTAASWMVQAGRPLAEVREILGHATMQTTVRYAHLMPEHLRDSMAALDAAVLGRSGMDTYTDTSEASEEPAVRG